MSGDLPINMNSENQLTEEKFLECVSIISKYFKNGSATEWTSTTDRSQICCLVKSGLYYDRQLALGNWTLKDEEIKCIDLIIEILMQKYNDLSRNINRAKIDFGVINIYGFQDISDGRKFFKIPIIQIMRSDYQGAYFTLINGLTFSDLDVMFNFIQNMPLATLCVPSQYACYIRYILSSEKEINLFKTRNIDENCFNECLIEIDFMKLMEKLCPNTYNEENITEEIPDTVVDKIQMLIEKLTTTIETNSSETMLDIEHVIKTETFVHSAILRGIIERLKLTWDRPYTVWRSIKKEMIEKEKEEVIEELLQSIHQGWIYESFKKYWITNRNLLFLNKNERITVCTFRLHGTEKMDLDPFIKEICDSEYVISDVVTRHFSCKKITFNDGRTFEIVFNEIIPKHILGCAIVQNSDAFFNDEENISPLKTDSNDDLSSNEEMEIDVREDLQEFSDDEKIELQEFLIKAKEEQVFIARTEGHFNPRILLKPDEEVLGDFVKLVIFGLDDNSKYEGLSEKNRNKMIMKIKYKIIKVAKKFGKARDRNQNVVYYDAIYLFGCNLPKMNLFKKKVPPEKKLYKLPLFKVYKNKNDENPIFIDVNCNEYTDWNYFLERNIVGKGDCFCVPKNGRYINEKEKKIEIEFFKNKRIYWTPARAALVGVNAAVLIGSTALAVYTGPIGWGIRALTLTTPLRLGIAGVGVCSSSIGLGITLGKKGLFISDKFQSYAPSITFVLNVTSDILMVYGETSVYASLAATVLIPTAACLSGFILCTLIFEAVNVYRNTGSIDPGDIWNIVRASLLFGNSVLKFGYVYKLIKSADWANKLPMLKGLSTPNGKITLDIINPNQLSRFFNFAKKTQCGEMVAGLLRDTANFFQNNKTLNEFKNDLKNFAKNFIDEIAEAVSPEINEFLKRRFGINLKTLTGNKSISELLDEYIPKIFRFILENMNEGKKLMQKIKNLLGFNESTEGSVEELARNIGEPLALKGPHDPMSNIDKIMKAEEFVKSTAWKKQILKLKLHIKNDTKITPELMDTVMKETVDEIRNDANHTDFKNKFEEYCSGYEKLILLEEDDTTKLYVFQYETEENLKMVVREEDINIETQLRKIEENIFMYKGADKTVVIFSDNENPNDRLGYMIICYNETRNLD